MIRERIKIWLFIAVLTICGTTSFASCSSNEDNATKQSNGKVAEIIERGTIIFGTTGDYRPLSFCEPDGTYWGFGIEVANEIAKRLGVTPTFKKTSWLQKDLMAYADSRCAYKASVVRPRYWWHHHH